MVSLKLQVGTKAYFGIDALLPCVAGFCKDRSSGDLGFGFCATSDSSSRWADERSCSLRP